MKTEISENDNYTEINIEGRLDTNTSAELEKKILELVNDGKEDLIINLSDLVYISSSGLRVFLVAAKSLDEKGKKLNFYGMKDYIKEVFDIAGFSILFNIYNKREDLYQ